MLLFVEVVYDVQVYLAFILVTCHHNVTTSKQLHVNTYCPFTCSWVSTQSGDKLPTLFHHLPVTLKHCLIALENQLHLPVTSCELNIGPKVCPVCNIESEFCVHRIVHI